MATKKFGKKLLVLSALACLGLTACSEDVISEPSFYENKIVTVNDTNDIYHNLISEIYDEYHDDHLPSEVLDKVLYKFSVSVIGEYNNVTKKANNSSDEVTLEDAYNSIKDKSYTKADTFINAHSAYQVKDDDGNRLTDEDAKARERAKVEAKYESIEKRISKQMYSKISGGSYSTRSVFNEEDFYMSLKNDGEKVATADVEFISDVITPEYDEEDVWNYYDTESETMHEGLLNRLLYQNGTTATYVEDNLIEDIYRDLLVEQYILDETYATLGRSYARKVNVIALTTNDTYDRAVSTLMNKFVNEIVTASPAVASNEKSDLAKWFEDGQVTETTFKSLSNLWKGVDLEDYQETFIKNYVKDASTGEDKTAAFGGVNANGVYCATDEGMMYKNYEKALRNDPNDSECTTQLSDFTGSYTYAKEIGYQVKTRDIQVKDYTTTGWYTKDGGISSLNSTITDRLFTLAVANALDRENPERYDRWQEVDGGGYEYSTSRDYNSYVARINGKYYLKTKTSEKNDERGNDILFYDSDSKTYYVVQIEEAINATKLSTTSENNYAHIYAGENDPTADNYGDMENIVNAILEMIADGDSYTTLSNKYWLEKANIKYHDDDVYDYFESNYPELFD